MGLRRRARRSAQDRARREPYGDPASPAFASGKVRRQTRPSLRQSNSARPWCWYSIAWLSMVVPKPATAGDLDRRAAVLLPHDPEFLAIVARVGMRRQRDLPGRARERAILGGIGGKLVKAEGKRECRVRLEPKIPDIEADAVPVARYGSRAVWTRDARLAHFQSPASSVLWAALRAWRRPRNASRHSSTEVALEPLRSARTCTMVSMFLTRCDSSAVNLPLVLFSLSPVVDVGRRPDPGRDPATGAPNGHGADQEPAILTIVALDAGFDLVPGLLPQRLVPLLDATLAVIGMQLRRRPVPGRSAWREAAEVEPAIIDKGDGPVRSGRPDDVRHGIGEIAEARLALQQSLLGALVLADVAGNLGGADDPPALIVDRRNRQGYVDQTAILAPPHRLEVLDLLPSPDALQNRRHLALVIGRGQNRDRTPDHFLGGIPEKPLGRRIPARDDAIQSLAHDRVVRRTPRSPPASRRPGLRGLPRTSQPWTLPGAGEAWTGSAESKDRHFPPRPQALSPGRTVEERRQAGQGLWLPQRGRISPQRRPRRR